MTFSRLLSPQLLHHCSLLVQYDYVDDVTCDDVFAGKALACIALRSLLTQPESIDNHGLLAVALLVS